MINGGVLNPPKINQKIYEKTLGFESQITGVSDKCIKPHDSIQWGISQVGNFYSILFTLNILFWLKNMHVSKLLFKYCNYTW